MPLNCFCLSTLEASSVKCHKVILFCIQLFGEIISHRVNSLVGIMFGKDCITSLNINLSIKEDFAGLRISCYANLNTFISA